ncbi:hypothetical protein [Devosia sp. 2618]|uniref:hypothetical protein n=1 Tax=Devosia sp. 2618 TaxID=3156454 RepID=UPI00339B31C4
MQTPASTRFTPRRSNLWALRLGYWFGRGYSAKEVAELTGEGTSEGTAKGQLRRAGLCPSKPRQVVVPIALPSWQRDAVSLKAAELGISMEVLLQRIIESGLVLDDLYSAICDDRYEQ